jgi:protein-L-isoaspartate(D-aspartate) O-methyltransferase
LAEAGEEALMDRDLITEAAFADQRERMVEEQIQRRGISDPAVLDAMRRIPRHLFVPAEFRSSAYADSPLPIGFDQTISQPYVVASMTEKLRLTSRSQVLEVGTGSGYQTAVLAEIVSEVYSLEFIPELADSAKSVLAKLGYHNVYIRVGDGTQGWPDKGSFDAIIVTAAATEIPSLLVNQLGPHGRMIIPVRVNMSDTQELILLTRTESEIRQEVLYQVRFVPLQQS